MWNLLKGVFRSLSKNKIAVIGLTFLIFISIGVYTVLTSCTSAISHTYNKVCNESNLHDFTVNELYRTSDPIFRLNRGECPQGEDSSQFKSIGYSADYIPNTSPTTPYMVPWALNNTENNGVWTRQYRFALDYTDITGDNSDVFEFWQRNKNNSEYEDLLFPELTIESDVELTYLDAPGTYSGSPQSTKTHDQINTELNEPDNLIVGDSKKSEQQQIDDFIKQKESELVNFVINQDSPMNDYLSDLKNNHQIADYQKFKALNITSSADSIYYKIVQANQEDTIDKIATFDNYKNLRSTNFSSNLNPNQHRDFNPLARFGDDYKNLLIARNDIDIRTTPTKDVLHCPFMKYADVVNNEEKIYIEAKILLMSLSNVTFGMEDKYNNDLIPLSEALQQNKRWDDWDSNLINKYNDFVNYIKPNSATIESIVNKGYRYTLQWSQSTGTIYSWQMDLFTSKFAFVNPQYMQANKKKPLDASLYENNVSYKTYKDNHGGNASLEDWLNSIPYKTSNDDEVTDINSAYTFSSWFNLICKNPRYLQYTVANSSGDKGLETPYIILGSAISANFMYPIVSLDRLIPNPKKECIIFTNQDGYQRINDAFRSSEVESYFVAKFNNGETKSNKTKILNDINDPNNDARKSMMYPNNIKIAYMNNDTSNVLSPAALRIAFIPTLIDKLILADAILVVFIFILSFLICIFVINNYISKKRIEIGIMRANGVRRRKIVFSLIPFALIPATIGAICGYFIGFLLQAPALNLFHNYWTLPSTFVGFNLLTLLISIIVPFLICFATSTLTSIFVLRKPTVKLFRSDIDYKSNIISRHIKRPFSSWSVISKFRISLAFNYLWKLLVLSVMSSLVLTSIIFAMSINGKFDEAKNTTYAAQKYNYAIDLFSPTTQGGQYIPYDSSYIGQNGFVKSVEGTNFIPNNMYDDDPNSEPQWTIDDSYRNMFGNAYYANNIHLSKRYYEDQLFNQFKLIPEYREFVCDNNMSFANMLYPNTDDGVGQQMDINYLKNRSMVKSFLDMKVGFSQMSTNPWGIATSLMPENNKMSADSKTDDLINEAGEKAFDSKSDWYNLQVPTELDTSITHIRDLFSYEDGKYHLNPDKCLAPLNSAISEALLWFEHILYSDSTIFNGEKAGNLDYNIQYNQIPLNSDDETYTYLSTTGVSKNIKGDDIRIVGLKQLLDQNGSLTNTISNKSVLLLDSNNDNIANRIAVDKQNYVTHPMIVNAYAAKKHHLKIGDTIQVQINNKSDRFDKILNNQTSSNDNVWFNVVGINQTFQNEEYYISQELANSLLGLRNHLDSTQNVNNWYFDYGNNGGITTGMSNMEFVTGFIDPSDYDESQVITYNLSDPQKLGIDNLNMNVNEDKCNLTPYGFNGVFEKSENGGLLNNGFYLYSPSGLYPASDSWNSKNVENLIKWGANTEVVNEIIFNKNKNNPLFVQIEGLYEDYKQALIKWKNGSGSEDDVKAALKALTDKSPDLIKKIINTFGNTAYAQIITNVIDKLGNQQIYNGLSNTINTLEVVILTCITLLVSLIVILISSMLISNSQKLSAILKALGYSDRSNLESFLAVYIPTIIIGLIIAIPISILLVFGFTNIIFGVGGILLTSSIHWWYYLIGIAGTIGLLSVSGFIGYYQLINESLVMRLKTN